MGTNTTIANMQIRNAFRLPNQSKPREPTAHGGKLRLGSASQGSRFGSFWASPTGDLSASSAVYNQNATLTSPYFAEHSMMNDISLARE
jgi:hypothetical protein